MEPDNIDKENFVKISFGNYRNRLIMEIIMMRRMGLTICLPHCHAYMVIKMGYYDERVS